MMFIYTQAFWNIRMYPDGAYYGVRLEQRKAQRIHYQDFHR